MDDKTALAFNTICNFIRDVNASFGTKQKALMLYGHLIEKTGLIHIEPVRKHIQIFQAFVKENEDAILGRKRNLMRAGKIVYSERVWIDLAAIFQMADREEESIIWNHLLTISAILNPDGKAKQVLKDLKNKPSTGSEDNFLKNIMEKIGDQIQSSGGEDANPMQMIGSMMSSGVFNEIFQGLSSGMSDGNMDIGKMMSSMQSMMSNLNDIVKDKNPSDAPSSAPSSATAAAVATTTIDTSDIKTLPSEE
jgi:hypothetical protein